ncbi:MAG TPA: protein phosphatase 2C domain-containing protein [Polyangiaceae bacterium]|nr:protein phosphatase 2C domain-containing protein [Polyangiaceae bacterium]
MSPDRVALPLEVVSAGETDRGIRRSSNEDSLLVRSDLGLYVVADGAGGHSAGNVASAIATSAVAKWFDGSEAEYRDKPEMDAFGLWTAARRLSIAVQNANTAVIDIARTSNRYRGMGTTIVCALLSPETGRLHIAHVGDSRCYRLRDGTLELLTHDHSILNDVMELYADLDDQALGRLPRKVITRALGLDERVRVALRTYRALVGDRYLLCSDGLTGELGESVLETLVGVSAPIPDVVRDLVRAAKEAGGRDNITALVVDCKQGTASSTRQSPPRFTTTARFGGSQPEIIASELSGSAAEIVFFNPPGKDDKAEPHISVVPVNSVDAQTIRALDKVAGALQNEERKCVRCSALMSGALACPRCGYTESEPLSRS